VWTGEPARTSDLVAKVRTLRSTERALYDVHMQALAGAAESMADAFERADARDVVMHAEGYGTAMQALGAACGAPIVEERLATLAFLARAHGGASKPSGAGGGDVAVAFFVDAASLASFRQSAKNAGFSPLDLDLGAEGVRVDVARA
jgi:phosphomevalonate kinase